MQLMSSIGLDMRGREIYPDFFWLFFYLLLGLGNGVKGEELPTVTVRGFLDFRTTVEGTVIVFVPSTTTEEPSPPSVSRTSQAPPADRSETVPLLSSSTPSVVFVATSTENEGSSHVVSLEESSSGETLQLLKQENAIVPSPDPSSQISETSQIYSSSNAHSQEIAPSSTAHFQIPYATEVADQEEKMIARRMDEDKEDPFLVIQSSFTSLNNPQPSSHPSPAFKSLPPFDGHQNKPSRSSSPRFRVTQQKREHQTVQLNRFKVRLNLHPSQEPGDHTNGEHIQDDDDDMEEEEVLNEIISSPPLGPHRVIEELQTITREVTLHVGRKKSVRTLTLTTTLLKTVEGDDVEVTSTSGQGTHVLKASSSIREGYFPTILPNTVETSYYSTDEQSWTTSVIPVLDGTVTSSYTVTELYLIQKFITVYKTIPSAAVTPPPSAMKTGIVVSTSLVTPEVIYSTRTFRVFDGRSTRERFVTEPASTVLRTLTLTTTLEHVMPPPAATSLYAVPPPQAGGFHPSMVFPGGASLPFPYPPPALFTPSPVVQTYTTVSQVTSISTRVYTLTYNGYNTKFRTVSSSSVFPTTLTLTTTLAYG